MKSKLGEIKKIIKRMCMYRQIYIETKQDLIQVSLSINQHLVFLRVQTKKGLLQPASIIVFDSLRNENNPVKRSQRQSIRSESLDNVFSHLFL